MVSTIAKGFEIYFPFKSHINLLYFYFKIFMLWSVAHFIHKVFSYPSLYILLYVQWYIEM